MYKKSSINLIPLLLYALTIVITGKNFAFADDTKILINIPSRTLELINNGYVEKIYPIGVGRPKFPTPIGDFKVISKIINPGWENPYKPAGESKIKPGQHNPLGTRWIGFHKNEQGEYGMHGTNMPFSVGRYSSHGCIRMKIKAAEDLFPRVDFGTPVLVRNYTHKIFVKNGKIVVRKFPNIYNIKVNRNESISEQLGMLSKYNINQSKFSRIDSMEENSSVEVGELILTTDKPGLKYKITEMMVNSD